MANEIKRRDPSKLYHNDYLTFAQNINTWCGTQAGEPDYPSHLVPAFGPLVDTLALALANWDDLNQDQKGKNDVFTNTSDAMAKQLQLLKDILPTTIDNPPVIAEFGLDRKVPDDRDDLFAMAQTCVNQWNEVSVPAVPPEYLPLESDFVVLVSLFSAFDVARAAYYAQFNAAQQAQNDVLSARNACHEQERKIFNWYRARHSDPQDEWWTGTWWGTSSGGEEKPEPEGVPWPGPMESFTLRQVMGIPLTVEVILSKINDCPRCVLEREQEGSGMWEYITEFDLEEEELLPFREKVPFAGIWHYRATPFNAAGEVGIASEGSIEVV